jgi:hypothetical protein
MARSLIVDSIGRMEKRDLQYSVYNGMPSC